MKGKCSLQPTAVLLLEHSRTASDATATAEPAPASASSADARPATIDTAEVRTAPDRPRIRGERIDVAAQIIVYTMLGLGRVFALSTLSDDEKRLHRRDIAKMFYRQLSKDPVDPPDAP